MTDKLVDDLKRALGDAYTIERELTGGGMSRVFVAREHALGREVVIKVLPPDLAAGVNRDRFRREVQLAARLSHPYIVPLLHAGEHEELLWFTMPFIAGESLKHRLQRNGALQLPEVLRLLRDVVEALAYAHSRGVIHRDIKPANILSDGAHALVTDFGVAKALNAALPTGGAGHTTSGMAIGTPAYMSPEQLAADPDADHRVDIYAVGLLAYELLSGASPFASPSPTATMTAQLTRVPEPLHQLNPAVPPAFSELIQRCLAKSPEDRPQDAQAILTELDRISGALAADAHRSTSGETPARAHASAMPLVLATVAVLALVGAGLWLSMRAPLQTLKSDSPHALAPTGDTGDLSLPAKPMTHADSLKIAEALRDELRQIDPTYSTRVRVKSAAVDTVPLDVEVNRTDSLIRARMAALYPQRPDVPAAPGLTAAPVAPAVGGRIATTVTATGTDKTEHRLAIQVYPNRREDTLSQRLERSIAVDLARRSGRGGQWDTVSVDSMPRGGPPSMPTANASDVFVTLAMSRDSTDSTRARIIIRSGDFRTNFAYKVVTSDPVYHPTSAAPFSNAIRDASRQLIQLRNLPPGVTWGTEIRGGNFDRGRGGGGQPGGGPGPFDPSTMRTMTRRLDSLKPMLDSMRRNGRGHRPDSF